MTKTINPISHMRVKESLLKGNTKSQALLDAGYSKASALHHSHRLTVCKNVIREIQEELKDDELISKLKNILRLKLNLEEEIYREISNDKKCLRKEKMQLLNKTKDNISETIKSLRLVCGESTDNFKIDDARKDRLSSMYDRIKQGTN